MQSFEYKCPTEIIFGRGAEEKTAQKIKSYGGSRVFVLYGGGSAIKSGLLARIERNLLEAGLQVQKHGGVQPNPRLSFAQRAAKAAKEFNADFILGVGGGSVIDTAKAVAHGVANPDVDIWDFWSGKEVTKSLPVGAVLTIAAAGSESSNSAVLTNEETGKKKGSPGFCDYESRNYLHSQPSANCLRRCGYYDAHNGEVFHQNRRK